MEALIIVTSLCYLFSTGGYLLFLFLQKEGAFKAAFGLILTGVLFHSVYLALSFFSRGILPVQNLHETLIMAGWAVACVFLILQYRYPLKVLGIYASTITTLIMLTALMVPRTPAPSGELFKSVWFVVHIISVFVGEAAFTLACGTGILYLIQEHAIKTKKRGFFYKRLPSLDLLDMTGYGCIIVGFTMLTLGLASGFVYAKLVWGRFWSWDPKEVWSGITWLLYAALLHERLTVGWRGRRAALMAIIGFIIVLFTFLGVNFLFTGHHVEFTRF